jgi:hypothetical protein
VFIVYGDMRFTDTSEMQASQPGPRHALVAAIAAERPDALFLTGDVPWHGGTADDYHVYREETTAWREQQLRVYPALGNHEFQQCAESQCLENWWQAFPPLRGRRWYSVALGSRRVQRRTRLQVGESPTEVKRLRPRSMGGTVA